ncbi:hypothetical protein CEXT_412471 [Caerostris extrusa]|uniref:Uncharacterized protein n=1 Tax=Caerostris extrusa TaxID=172846 RepID=A0AAV4T3T8_CAEEX|nr:hypothetical protein CEXT_412471 [Caerostris extrusa]
MVKKLFTRGGVHNNPLCCPRPQIRANRRKGNNLNHRNLTIRGWKETTRATKQSPIFPPGINDVLSFPPNAIGRFNRTCHRLGSLDKGFYHLADHRWRGHLLGPPTRQMPIVSPSPTFRNCREEIDFE